MVHSSIFLSSSTNENITTREKKLQLLQQQRMDINLVKRRKNYYIVLPQHQTINMYQPASTASLWDFYHKENGAIVWWDNIHNTMQNVHIVIEHIVHIVIELPTAHYTQYSNALCSQHLLWRLRPFRKWMKILFENAPWDFFTYPQNKRRMLAKLLISMVSIHEYVYWF